MHASKTGKVLIARKAEHKKSTCRECAERLRYCTKSNLSFRFIRFIMKNIITLETTKKNDL